MDLNFWSFVLSAIGLALGLIAAWSQLKAIGSAALEAGNSQLQKLAATKLELASRLAKSPTALIAYIARDAIGLVIVSIIAFGLVLQSNKTQIPELILFAKAVALVAGFGVGFRMSQLRFLLTRVIRVSTDEPHRG